MSPKHHFLLLLMFIGHYSTAQTFEVEKKIQRIDSLMVMYYKNYDLVESEAEALYNLFETKYTEKIYKEYKVRVMLQMAVLYSLKTNYAKALNLALKASDEAQQYKLTEGIYQSYLIIAIMYEVVQELDLCRIYLDKAYEVYFKNGLDRVYSTYCIRMSSYFRYKNEKDSAVWYAYQGLEYAKQFKNIREERDAYLLLGILLRKDKYREAVKFSSLASKKFITIEDFSSAAGQLINASSNLLEHYQIEDALKYSDSARAIIRNANIPAGTNFYKNRYQLFESLGNQDSSFWYFKKYHDSYVEELTRMDASEVKKITEQHEIDKKEIVIKNRSQLLVLAVGIALLVAISALLLYRQNRKIRSQNTFINKQMQSLQKILDQKHILLQELQHRVKNNLQQVISILEIQKESIDFSNIEELVRENQNRIHSMALLHTRLNSMDDINVVNLREYLTGLSGLVKDSYANCGNDFALNLRCNIEHMTIEKALPIGLILVELISNSIKYAFNDREEGVIKIVVEWDENLRKNILHYTDNGKGFDFHLQGRKGLGLEIIRGLIDQLYGTFETQTSNGFELKVYFELV
jgi:two-component sensor histidine kinase